MLLAFGGGAYQLGFNRGNTVNAYFTVSITSTPYGQLLRSETSQCLHLHLLSTKAYNYCLLYSLVMFHVHNWGCPYSLGSKLSRPSTLTCAPLAMFKQATTLKNSWKRWSQNGSKINLSKNCLIIKGLCGKTFLYFMKVTCSSMHDHSKLTCQI